jgi:hypothetical protein
MSDHNNVSNHSDIRGEDQAFKRDRDHAQKWRYVPQVGKAPVKYGGNFGYEPNIDERTGKVIIPKGFGP